MTTPAPTPESLAPVRVSHTMNFVNFKREQVTPFVDIARGMLQASGGFEEALMEITEDTYTTTVTATVTVMPPKSPAFELEEGEVWEKVALGYLAGDLGRYLRHWLQNQG